MSFQYEEIVFIIIYFEKKNMPEIVEKWDDTVSLKHALKMHTT
jgi:hypothetical protein